MTGIHIHQPEANGSVPANLTPLPMGGLAIAVWNLLDQAADLPDPTSVTVYDHQSITLQFSRQQASIRNIAGWARRFGSVVTSYPGKVEAVLGTWYITDFDYYGITVNAFAFIPADPAS